MSGVDSLGGELIDALIWLQWDGSAISSLSAASISSSQSRDSRLPHHSSAHRGAAIG